MAIANCDSCPESDLWPELRICEIAVDFRRFLRIDSEFGKLTDYLMTDSIFEEKSMLGVFDRLSNEIYERCEDGSAMIVKTISAMKSKESLKTEIEKQLNLSHPSILGPIDFIFGSESTESGELKIVSFYSEGNSLSEVVSQNPVWWTVTAKGKQLRELF
jgi:serine/threonine protein kinase